MTQRLPVPGSDDGTWGDILNGFLEVSHASDGTLNSSVVGTAQLENNAVTNAQLDSPTQSTLSAVASKYVKPSGGIPTSDLDSSTQTNIGKAGTAVQIGGDLGGTATAPTLAKIQGTTVNGSSPANGQALVYSSGASAWVPATVTSTTVSDATTSSKGIVELASDLSGTASAPTVVSTHLSSALPINQGGTGSTTQNFVDLSSTQTVAGNKTLSGTTTASTLNSTSHATTNLQVTGGTPASGKVLTSDSSGNATWTTPTSGSSTLAADTDVNVSGITNGQVLTYNTSSSKWVNQAAPTASNATTNATGLVQLSGDLAGTATSPTVAKVNGITLPGTAPTAGNVLTATSGTATSWTTPAAGVTLDSTSSDIVAGTTTGSGVAGSTGKAADAGHQHPLVAHDHTTTNKGGQIPVGGLSATGTASSSTYLRGDGSWSAPAGASNATTSAPGLVQLSGDLTGTATSPTVAKLNGGITLPGTAPSASGQVLTTTSSGTSATTSWTTPAAGVMLDSTASDIQPLGTQTAGSTGKAADAGHIHTMPRLDQVNAPTAAVALNTQKITGLANGTATTDAAAFGQIPVAGTTAGTYAVGNDSRFTAASQVVMTPLSSPITSAYTANPGDVVQVNAAGGAVIVKLPSAPADKSRVTVKLISGTSVTNVATVQTQGSDVYDVTSGSTSATLILQNQAKTFQYQASSGIWYGLASDMPLSALVTGSTRSVTSTYTLVSSDHVVLADATSAAFTITLPTAVGFSGRYTIDAVSTGNNVVTVATTSSQTIDGSSTTTLGTQASGAAWSSVDLVSDGANWHTV
jgi:hypothetical protein